MAHKNNKKNRKRVAFYEINKFDYEAKEKLVEGQLSSKKTLAEKKGVEKNLENAWTEV